MSSAGCVLGFDYGRKRIGVAVGQNLTATAKALATLHCVQNKPDWDRIQRYIQEWQPQALIVGVPKHADGTSSESTEAALRFSRQLHGRYGLPVHTVDETLSSVEAASQLKQRKLAAHLLDAVSAEIILITWLSECH
ncbi:MAG: Holliday junction resolvase RuvX [Thiotrichaceae bacterium]|nr:Holliday junction resolvase RuvX [Thiotrichaceae bacterium]